MFGENISMAPLGNVGGMPPQLCKGSKSPFACQPLELVLSYSMGPKEMVPAAEKRRKVGGFVGGEIVHQGGGGRGGWVECETTSLSSQKATESSQTKQGRVLLLPMSEASCFLVCGQCPPLCSHSDRSEEGCLCSRPDQ